jgi:hypothetical protein
MGVVWRALDTLIERTVALKELRAPVGLAVDDSFVERSLREARNAGRLNHPGVVSVYDVIAPTAEDDGVYIVMEYVEAPTLGDILEQQGPLPAARVAAMGVGILDALMAAHAMGIVHRDIKPSNVLVRDGDRVKLSDFGIALAAEDSRLTRSGVMGTHAYMAPESFDAGQVGPAADLWALGATLFHAVAGQAPFERDTTTATLRAILFEDPPRPPCEPVLAEAITGLLTRPAERRLGGDAARALLQRAATVPAALPPPPTGTGAQAGWEAQATSFHRPPPPSQVVHPPSPYYASGPGRPASPTGPTYYGTGPQHPQQHAPQRSSAPLLLGGALAGVAALVLVVVLVGRGGSDSDGGGGGGAGPGGTGDTSGYTEEMHQQFLTDCTREFTDVTVSGIDGDQTCDCAWSAVKEAVPADVYSDAVAAGGGATPSSLPDQYETQLENALASCIPTDLSIPTTTP